MKNLTRRDPTFILFIVFVLPFLVILYLLVSEIGSSIRFADQERLGLEYARGLRDFVQNLQQHRTAAMGDVSALGAVTAKVDAMAMQVDAIDHRLGGELRASDRWAALRREVARAHAQVCGCFAGRFHGCARCADRGDDLARASCRRYLEPDPRSGSRFVLLHGSSRHRTPPGRGASGAGSHRRIGAAERISLGPDERTLLITRTAAIRDALASLDRGMKVAFQQNQTLREALATHAAAMVATNEFLDLYGQKAH